MKYSVVLIYSIYPSFIFGHILSELQNIEKLRKQFSVLHAELDQPKSIEFLNKSDLKIDLFHEFSLKPTYQRNLYPCFFIEVKNVTALQREHIDIGRHIRPSILLLIQAEYYTA